MLLAESTAGSGALGGFGFLGVSAVALAGALFWFPFVTRHPPQEGTLRFEHWRILTSRYLHFYRWVLLLAAVAFALASVGVFVDALILL